jgi:hypothetical protein
MRGLILFTSLFLCSTAFAGYDSAYTDFNLKTCKQLTPETSGEDGESSGVMECKGYKGMPVTFAEGDLRSFVAFGEGGQDHCAFHQTFGGFNSPGNKIEWRLKEGKAIATILRWTVSYDSEDSSKTKTWLVVTKIDEGQSCQIGYVEGSYPQANEKARWLADTAAEVFSCEAGKTIFFASPGTATDGIAPEGGCEGYGD